ncbi:hypothetical protein OAM79_02510 [Litorivicinus sp.]|nr:hypothetical protein [Litorivicinus sp.]
MKATILGISEVEKKFAEPVSEATIYYWGCSPDERIFLESLHIFSLEDLYLQYALDPIARANYSLIDLYVNLVDFSEKYLYTDFILYYSGLLKYFIFIDSVKKTLLEKKTCDFTLVIGSFNDRDSVDQLSSTLQFFFDVDDLCSIDCKQSAAIEVKSSFIQRCCVFANRCAIKIGRSLVGFMMLIDRTRLRAMSQSKRFKLISSCDYGFFCDDTFFTERNVLVMEPSLLTLKHILPRWFKGECYLIGRKGYSSISEKQRRIELGSLVDSVLSRIQSKSEHLRSFVQFGMQYDGFAKLPKEMCDSDEVYSLLKKLCVEQFFSQYAVGDSLIINRAVLDLGGMSYIHPHGTLRLIRFSTDRVQKVHLSERFLHSILLIGDQFSHCVTSFVIEPEVEALFKTVDFCKTRSIRAEVERNHNFRLGGKNISGRVNSFSKKVLVADTVKGVGVSRITAYPTFDQYAKELMFLERLIIKNADAAFIFSVRSSSDPFITYLKAKFGYLENCFVIGGIDAKELIGQCDVVFSFGSTLNEIGYNLGLLVLQPNLIENGMGSVSHVEEQHRWIFTDQVLALN